MLSDIWSAAAMPPHGDRTPDRALLCDPITFNGFAAPRRRGESLGCDMAQGHFISRPLSAQDAANPRSLSPLERDALIRVGIRRLIACTTQRAEVIPC